MASIGGYKTLSEIKNRRRLIWKNCEKLCEEYGVADVEILHEGVTGGYWCDYKGAICEKCERSNAANYIKRHGEWHNYLKMYFMPECFIVTGAGVGGSRGHLAKRKEFVVARVVY